MIQDLHAHTYYSFCGKDAPETIVEAAIAGGIRLFGITDHNYGIGFSRYDFFVNNEVPVGTDYYRCLRRYYDHINLIREKYADRITVLRGIEVCTLRTGRHALPKAEDVSYFDYCLIENLDAPREQTVTENDLFAYAARLGCRVGVAHTDLFALIQRLGEDPLSYFSRMAEQGIFWEMNVSYDSIHHYRVHPYMLQFFDSPEQQEIVRRSGVQVSVGFDGHRVEDYAPDRVRAYCRKLEEMKIPQPFAEL